MSRVRLTSVLQVRVPDSVADEVYRLARARYDGDTSAFLRDYLLGRLTNPGTCPCCGFPKPAEESEKPR